MRTLTFTNSRSQTVVFGRNPILMDDIQGIGGIPVDVASQKAPYQDGSTFIDANFEERIITIECQLVADRTLAQVYARRDTIIGVCNPKLGEGWLQFDYEGSSKRIRAVPTEIEFSDKKYTDSTQTFQLSFRCSDPLWQDLTDKIVTMQSITGTGKLKLPTTADNEITVSVVDSAIMQNGDVAIVYKKYSNSKLAFRRKSGGVWSDEIELAGVIQNGLAIVETTTGNLLVVFSLDADANLYSIKFDGTSWGTAQVIATGFYFYSLDLLKKSDGNILLFFDRSPNTVAHDLCSMEYSTSWSSATVISSDVNFAYVPRATQKLNGNIFLVYSLSAGMYSKEYSGSWGAQSASIMVATPAGINTKTNGDLNLVVISGGGLRELNYTTSWSGDVVFNTFSSTVSAASSFIDSTDKITAIVGVNTEYIYEAIGQNYFTSDTPINSSATSWPCVVETSTGDEQSFYIRNSDNYLVTRSSSDSWASETVITSASCEGPAAAVMANGNIVVVYRRNSDGYLVSKVYTGSWSAETVVNAAASKYASATKSLDGNYIYIAYVRTSDNYLIFRLSNTLDPIPTTSTLINIGLLSLITECTSPATVGPSIAILPGQ